MIKVSVLAKSKIDPVKVSGQVTALDLRNFGITNHVQGINSISCSEVDQIIDTTVFSIMTAHIKEDIFPILFADDGYGYYNRKTNGYFVWLQSRGSDSVGIYFNSNEYDDWIQSCFKEVLGDEFDPSTMQIQHYENSAASRYIRSTRRNATALDRSELSSVDLPVWWLGTLDGLMLLPEIHIHAIEWFGGLLVKNIRYAFMEETTDLAVRVFQRLLYLGNEDLINYLESYADLLGRATTVLTQSETLTNLNDYFGFEAHLKPISYYVEHNAPEPYLYFEFKNQATANKFYDTTNEHMIFQGLCNDWCFHTHTKLALRIEGNLGRNLDELDYGKIDRFLQAHGIKKQNKEA